MSACTIILCSSLLYFLSRTYIGQQTKNKRWQADDNQFWSFFISSGTEAASRRPLTYDDHSNPRCYTATLYMSCHYILFVEFAVLTWWWLKMIIDQCKQCLENNLNSGDMFAKHKFWFCIYRLLTKNKWNIFSNLQFFLEVCIVWHGWVTSGVMPYKGPCQ